MAAPPPKLQRAAAAAAKDDDDMPPSPQHYAAYERAATTQSNILSAAPSVGKAFVVIVGAAIFVGGIITIVYQVQKITERLESDVQALKIANATRDERDHAIAATLAEIKAATGDIPSVRYDLNQVCSHIKDAHCSTPHP